MEEYLIGYIEIPEGYWTTTTTLDVDVNEDDEG